MTDNFDLWKRVAQEQYPNRPDQTYQMIWEHAASDWAFNRDSNIAKLFDQYVMLKQLMSPEGKQNGN